MSPIVEPVPPRAESTEEEILTLEELASRLKLSTWTIRRLIKRRILAPLRSEHQPRYGWRMQNPQVWIHVRERLLLRGA